VVLGVKTQHHSCPHVTTFFGEKFDM